MANKIKPDSALLLLLPCTEQNPATTDSPPLKKNRENPGSALFLPSFRQLLLLVGVIFPVLVRGNSP
ncbi:hypothetical protein SLEP1_g12218 [Rubroshorea leprosula]|uniref:Uncharacterized protein n=1 Tax=Rubroshorea leprosula TaxID=152421 RepID=A0AAV5IBS1_9ROSI|nr:hypothetical protein SLEP1_g12218 [Rubroshorea leprosula]